MKNAEKKYGYDKHKIQCVLNNVQARRKQIEILLKLFGPPSSLACPSIFLYGHSATGKSLLVSTIMQQLQLHHVWINCVETYSIRYLFEAILNAFSKQAGSDNDNCDNMCDFMYKLKTLIQDCTETVFIVLDNAEMLRNLNQSVLSTFLKLQELTSMNVCVILISEIVWEKFQHTATSCDPYIIHFPDYSKDELLSIMMLRCPSEMSQNLYLGYLRMILGVFYLVTRNLKELQHLANLNISKYLEPITLGEVNETQVHKLWKNIEPYLKKALHTVYLRVISSYKWEEELKDDSDKTLVMIPKKFTELPFYSKFLLIASYLASFNLPKTDRKFFVKNQGKVSKKRMKKERRLHNHLIGPKPFLLDRMLAIFYSVIDENIAPSAMIFSQIASLVSLRLLMRTTHSEDISLSKYKCLVDLDTIKNISRTVDFDIAHYLEDFT